MINYNESNIVVSFIKELLHSFNLPSYKVKNTHPYDGEYYIDGGHIVKYQNGYTITSNYHFNEKINNITTNLIINSDTYDEYTHKYLGDYLRFIRDYKGINLMPLYNCFFPKSPYNKSVVQKVYAYLSNISPSVDESFYSYYIVPVKFNETYTVGVNSASPVDVMLMLYDDGLVLDCEDLCNATYASLGATSVHHPCVVSTEIGSKLVNEYIKQEDNLYLLIRVSKSSNNVVILEGDYRACTGMCGIANSEIVYNDSLKDGYQVLSTQLSLLSYLDGKSHPFADRLIEYLVGQAITSSDIIENNISRLQKVLYKNKLFVGLKDVFDANIGKEIYREMLSPSNVTRLVKTGSGNKITARYIDTYKDLLMYGDKDVEFILNNKG